MKRVVLLLSEDGLSIETDVGELEFHVLDFSDFQESGAAFYVTPVIRVKTPKQLDSFVKRWLKKAGLTGPTDEGV